MADSISIVMKMNDDISGKLKSIASTSKGVSKEFEVLQNRADALGKRYADFNQMSAKTAAEALDVKRAMDEAAKSFKKTGDEADQVRFQQLREEYTALTDAAKTYAEEAKQTQKAMRETYDQARKLEDGAGGGSGGFLTSTFGKTLGGALAASGVIREIGSSLTGAATVGLESAVGQPVATALNSTLSGAFSGAAAGAIAGPVGAAIGALGGGIAGAISGGTRIFEQQDDAFKSYVQNTYDTVTQEQADALSSGSTIAGSREQTLMAFAQKLGGDQAAADYLGQVKEMAKSTNYTYDQITGYSKLLLNSYGTDETLDVLMKLSDATAGLNLNGSDNELWIAGLSRMRTTGKVTQEYLNYFSERGLDVYQALADATGADKSQIADMVSGGEISGGIAAQAILDYIEKTFGGLSERLAGTYDAMVDNLGDYEAELDAAVGEGYNEGRKSGLQAQMDWLAGESGEAVEEANRAVGAWKAELENQKEQYIRDAMDAMMASDEYQTAKATGDAAEMGRLIMQAKVQGMNDYNASEGAQEALAAEKALVDNIRADTSLNQDYWDAGYEKGQWFTKGLAAHIGGWSIPEYESLPGDWSYNADTGNSNAYGLKYVPYDGYPALLHQGEQVLTAEEARRKSRVAADSVSVTITGPVTVRQDSDIDAIAVRLAEELEARALAYGG